MGIPYTICTSRRCRKILDIVCVGVNRISMLHPTNALILSMLLFATGAMLSAMIFAFSYFAQLNYGNANVKWAHRWHAWTYVVVLFSLALFIAGIASAAYGFLNLP
jgi:hypothetical protein